MDDEQIKRTWRNMLIPLVIGVVVLITTILIHELGSKKPVAQTISIYGAMLGSVFIVLSLINITKFRRYLKSRKDDSKENSEN